MEVVTESRDKPNDNKIESIPFSDVEFSIQGRSIRAHRCILTIKSEYFRAMFLSGMKESHDAIIPIEDVAYEAFERMLEFIYFGRLTLNFSDDVHVLGDLTYLAEKYLLTDLKIKIVELLREALPEVPNAEFTTLFPHIANVDFLVDEVVRELIVRWDGLDDRDNVIDFLFDHAPKIARAFVKRVMHPKDLENVRRFLSYDVEKDFFEKDLLESGEWKNLVLLRKHFEEKGVCESMLPLFLRDDDDWMSTGVPIGKQPLRNPYIETMCKEIERKKLVGGTISIT